MPTTPSKTTKPTINLLLTLTPALLALTSCAEPPKRGGASEQIGTPAPSAGDIPPPSRARDMSGGRGLR